MALRWLEAYYRNVGPAGALSRKYPIKPSETGALILVTDASPWGLGAVLYDAEQPVGYFSDLVSPEDELRFSTTKGRCNDQAVWEALAILVAVRALPSRRGASEPGGTLLIRSDSTSAIGALRKMRSPDPRISAIAREFALWAALNPFRISWEHIDGDTNSVADTLSRGGAPVELRGVERVNPTPRTPSYWRTAGPPKG